MASRTASKSPAAKAAKKAPVKKAAPAAPKRPATKAAKAPITSTTPVPKAEIPAERPKKPKLVRDSFTIPKAEYAVIGALKERAIRLGRPAKKSELLRAGIQLLAAAPDAGFAAALAAVPAIKTGRPAKD